MSTQYLTAEHQDPGQFIRHGDMLIPREIYQADPTTYGLIAHVTADGPAPLGYTDWVLVDGAYHREPAGTEAERDQAVLEQWRASAVVTALQGMLAIKQAGLTAAFVAWKAALNPVDDFEVIAFFEKAQTWRRDNIYLIQGATALGLTDAQIDELFVLAVTL